MHETPLTACLWRTATDDRHTAHVRRRAARALAVHLLHGAEVPPDYDQSIHEAAMQGAFL